MTGYGLWEKNQFVLREETLPILPAGFGPIRVLHLSDIHFVPGQQRKAEWLSSLAELRPDLVVNTGDNLSHANAVQPLLESLRPLMEFPGVFVPGSNDYFAPQLKNPASYFLGPSSKPKAPAKLDWPRLRSGFGMGGWVDLTNRCQSLVVKGLRIDFSGVDDPHLGLERYAGWPRGTKGQDTRAAPPRRRDPCPLPARPGPFHRGRRRPAPRRAHPRRPDLRPGFGALVANCDLPTWRAKGLHDWESKGRTTPVNVSGGIGTSRFAPVRIACKPEAVLLTLTERS